MSITTFHGFLTTAGLHHGLLVDLCAEKGVISRSQLLAYMSRHQIPPIEKDKLIERYCRASILYEEADFEYTVNPVVSGLVNFYERRGKLTNADFLRDQIYEIGKLTDILQQCLFAEEPDRERVADTVDKLFLVVREVRESGYQHYQACMRSFGDMKRNSAGKAIDVRIEALKKVYRRYIEPLKELIDPDAEPVAKMALLRRRMTDLGENRAFLADSVELDTCRARLNIDIQYIDFTLIRHFETLIDTSRALLNSLIEEKNIKDALACCLGNLGRVWLLLQEETVVVPGLQVSQSAPMDRLGIFFNDVVHGKFVPRPRSLSMKPPREENADHLLIFERSLMDRIETNREIRSWPGYVTREFDGYPPDEQLKAIAFPLVLSNPPFSVRRMDQAFYGDLGAFSIELSDFDIVWKGPHGA